MGGHLSPTYVGWHHHPLKTRVGKVTPIASSRYCLHLVIFADKLKEWVLFVIYNSQSLQIQKFLCYGLFGISILSSPWILMGNFNAILNSTEHGDGGFYHYNAKSKYSSDFVSNCHLFDLGFMVLFLRGVTIRMV